ncbi:hypothetical protein [Stappia sp.]|uniref:hypothetical protein n=1 Tax=Stappia sp. TaxID=1870903 RepID=UPI0032D92A7C
MAKVGKPVSRSGHVTYSMRPHKQGRGVFSDVKLPDGTIIRRVDESVHRAGLKRVKEAFRKHEVKEPA